MPHTKSIAKRIHQTEARRLRNKVVRSQVRTIVKKTDQMIGAGDKDRTQSLGKEAFRTIDKACSKGVLHHKTAARLKSRLSRRISTVG